MKLKTEKIYIYYDIPIVFSARSVERDDIFICLFADETDSDIKYLCTSVSQEILGALERNEKDVRSIFESSEKKYSILLNAKSHDNLEAVELSEDITPFLPETGLFIGVQQEQESTVSQKITIRIPPDVVDVRDTINRDVSNYADESTRIMYHLDNEVIFSGELQWLMKAA